MKNLLNVAQFLLPVLLLGCSSYTNSVSSLKQSADRFDACGFDFELDAFESRKTYCEDQGQALTAFVSCSQTTYLLYQKLSKDCRDYFREPMQVDLHTRINARIATQSQDNAKDAAFVKELFAASVSFHSGIAPENVTVWANGIESTVRLIWSELYKKMSDTSRGDRLTMNRIIGGLSTASPSDTVSMFHGVALLNISLETAMPRLELLASLRQGYCLMGECETLKIDGTLHGLASLLADAPADLSQLDGSLSGVKLLIETFGSSLRDFVRQKSINGTRSSIIETIRSQEMPISLDNLAQKMEKISILVNDLGPHADQSAQTQLISSGLDFDTVKSLMSLFEKRNVNSKAQLDEFLQKREAQRVTLLNLKGNEDQYNSLLPQVEAKRQIAADLRDDLLSVQDAFRKGEKQKQKALDGLESLPGIQFYGKSKSQREIDSLAVAARDAKFKSGSTGADFDLKNLSVKSYALDAGRSLSVQVEGFWSPTCALKTSAYMNTLSSIVGIQVGPEGFVVTQADQNAKVQSVTDARSRSRSQNSGTSTNIPAGAVITAGVTMVNPLAGAVVGVFANGAHYSYGESSSRDNSSQNTNSDSNTFSHTASFQDGLRLANTPFMNFPAGSLLAVKVPRGESNWRNAQTEFSVVNRSTTLVADKDSDIFLVVNDCLGETMISDSVSTSALNVRVSENIPVEEAGKSFLKLLGSLSTRYKDQALAIAQEGGNTAVKAEALKSEILKAIQTESATSSIALSNEALRSVLHAWLDQFSLQIYRQSEIREITRRLALADYDLASLNVDLLSQQQKAEIQSIFLAQALDNVDFSGVSAGILRTQGLFQRSIVPLLKVYSPSVLNKTEALRAAARNLSMEQDIESLVNDSIKVNNEVIASFEEHVNLNLNSPDRNVVFVSFPNPAAQQLPSEYPSVDRARSSLFWNALFSQGNIDPSVQIPVQAQDLYAKDRFSKGYLDCSNAAPMIKNMALFVMYESEYFTADQVARFSGTKIGVSIGDESHVLSNSGDQIFRNESNTIGQDNILVHLLEDGKHGAIGSILAENQNSSHTLKGFAPFTSYQWRGKLNRSFDLANGKLENMFDIILDPTSGAVKIPEGIKEIVMAFELDVQKNTGFNAASFVESCR